MLALLEADHHEMRRLIDHQQGFRTPERIAELRWHFDKCVARHLHTLRTEIYPSLRRGRNPSYELITTALAVETDRLLEAYNLHKRTFPADRLDGREQAFLDSSDSSSSRFCCLSRMRNET